MLKKSARLLRSGPVVARHGLAAPRASLYFSTLLVPRSRRGQASVELALCLPVVAVLLLLVVQAGLVVADQVAVVQAAREGARRASVDPDPEAARQAALGGRMVPGRTVVTSQRVAGRPELARVDVRHRGATDVPIVGRLLPDVELSASAVMAVEGG